MTLPDLASTPQAGPPRRPSARAAATGTRVYRPHFDEATRRRAADFARAKGETLRPVYVSLCLAVWLHRHAGREAISGADVRALFPTTDDGATRHLRNPTDFLRRARDAGLMASLGEGWYAVTPFGHAVVDALPDVDAVAGMLGRMGAKCARRRRGWAGPR